MKQYLDLLRDVSENGEIHHDRTGVGTKSVFGRQLRFNLQEGFPLVTTKKVFVRGIIEELLWFLSGDTNAKTLKDKNVHIWDEWATPEQTARFGREENDLGPIYGHLWRNFGASRAANAFESLNSQLCLMPTQQKEVNSRYKANGFDQISWLVDEIRTNPNSRRLIVTGWDPWQQNNVALPPCHTLFQFKVHEEKELSCQLYQRSADLFLGIPFNIASYALLTMMIAQQTGLVAREFIHTFGDCHIYLSHTDQVAEQLSREPRPLPRMYIDKAPDIFSYQYRDFNLADYNPYPPIQAPVAI